MKQKPKRRISAVEKRLRAEIARLRELHAGQECNALSVMDCAGREPMHYHHDGCPYEHGLERALSHIAKLGTMPGYDTKDLDMAALARRALRLPEKE